MRKAAKKFWEFGVLVAPAATILIALIIVVLSLVPPSGAPGATLNDKVNHLLAYWVLAGTAIIGFHWVRRTYLVLALIAFGCILEILQGVMPFGREASIFDVVANTLGITVGIATAQFTRIFLEA
ncbi:MAG: VanZ family protein [Pseudomonadota bacterium]